MISLGELRKLVLDKFPEEYPSLSRRKGDLEEVLNLITTFVNKHGYNQKYVFEILKDIVESYEYV
jgi:hypothetical protein